MKKKSFKKIVKDIRKTTCPAWQGDVKPLTQADLQAVVDQMKKVSGVITINYRGGQKCKK